MYTTKPLSAFQTTPAAGQQLPQQGPSSGYLVLQQEDLDQETDTCCFGVCCGPRIRDLPFPQNKILTVKYSRQEGQYRRYFHRTVLFVPVTDLPLVANRYYVVVADGKHKGKMFTFSKEEDLTPCCFCNCISDVKPMPFDHRDIYQQIEIIPHKGKFTAKSVASDGFVPWIFRQKYWTLHENTPTSYKIDEALGLNTALRSNILEMDVSVNRNVGKWYCPFFFVKEGKSLKEQMERTMYYEVTLEQFYERVYSGVEKKRVLFEGKEAMREERTSVGVIWFAKRGDLNEERIGLSLALWERVKWEEIRGGWIEENEEIDKEVRFESFVMVERFLFERMDGSSAFSLDFVHTNKIIAK